MPNKSTMMAPYWARPLSNRARLPTDCITRYSTYLSRCTFWPWPYLRLLLFHTPEMAWYNHFLLSPWFTSLASWITDLGPMTQMCQNEEMPWTYCLVSQFLKCTNLNGEVVDSSKSNRNLIRPFSHLLWVFCCPFFPQQEARDTQKGVSLWPKMEGDSLFPMFILKMLQQSVPSMKHWTKLDGESWRWYLVTMVQLQILILCMVLGSWRVSSQPSESLNCCREPFWLSPHSFDFLVSSFPSQMWLNYHNMWSLFLGAKSKDVVKKVEDFLEAQEQWAKKNVEMHGNDDPFWRHVGYIMRQLDGLYDGYLSVADKSWVRYAAISLVPFLHSHHYAPQ